MRQASHVEHMYPKQLKDLEDPLSRAVRNSTATAVTNLLYNFHISQPSHWIDDEVAGWPDRLPIDLDNAIIVTDWRRVEQNGRHS